MKVKYQNAPVLTNPIDICLALVGLKDIAILSYRRPGPTAEISVEQQVGAVHCKECGTQALVKERPWVS